MGSYVCWAWIHESQVQCSYLRHSTNLGFFSEIKMDYKLSFFKKNHILIFPLEGKTWFSDFRNGETKSETQFFFGDSGSNPFGDNGCSGTDFDGNGVGGSGGSSFNALGIDA